MSRTPYSFFLPFDAASVGGTDVEATFPQAPTIFKRTLELSASIKFSGFVRIRGFYTLSTPAEERIEVKQYVCGRLGGNKLPYGSALPPLAWKGQARAEAVSAIKKAGGLVKQECEFVGGCSTIQPEKDDTRQKSSTCAMAEGRRREECFKHVVRSKLRDLGLIKGVVPRKSHAGCDHSAEIGVWDWLFQQGMLPIGFEVPVGINELRLKETFDHDAAPSGRIDIVCMTRSGEYVIVDVKTRCSDASPAVVVADVFQLYMYGLLWNTSHRGSVRHLLIVTLYPKSGKGMVHSVRFVPHLMAHPLFKQRSCGFINFGLTCTEDAQLALCGSITRLNTSVTGIGEDVKVHKSDGKNCQDTQVHDGTKKAADGGHKQTSQHRLDDTRQTHSSDEDAQEHYCILA